MPCSTSLRSEAAMILAISGSIFLPMNGTFTFRSPSTTKETSPSPESSAVPSMSAG